MLVQAWEQKLDLALWPVFASILLRWRKRRTPVVPLKMLHLFPSGLGHPSIDSISHSLCQVSLWQHQSLGAHHPQNSCHVSRLPCWQGDAIGLTRWPQHHPHIQQWQPGTCSGRWQKQQTPDMASKIPAPVLSPALGHWWTCTSWKNRHNWGLS